MNLRFHSPSFLPAVAALLAAIGLAFLLLRSSDAFEDSFLKVALSDIRLRTEDVTEELSGYLRAGELARVKAFAEDSRNDGIWVSVMDASGATVVDAGRHFTSAKARHREFVEALANGESVTIRPAETFGEYMLFSSRKVGDYVVRLVIPYRQARKAMRTMLLAMGVSAFIGIFASLAIFLVTRRLVHRIEGLAAERAEQARRLAEVERQERFRREFLENVSHEIKTPVAAVVAAVEMLDDPGVTMPEAERRSLLTVAHKEGRRIESLVNDLLQLARLESAECGHPPFGPCDFGDAVRLAVERFTPMARAADVALTCDIAEGVAVKGDSRSLETAVGNLISNALKYGGGSDVQVVLAREGDRAVLKVSDEGLGIAPEHLERIFERFYRVDKARSRESGGTGLGLAIVKHVALLHGGSVACESEVGKGCTFRMELPCVLS